MTPRPTTLPLPIMLFALTAIVGLFLVSGSILWVLAALALLILASYVLRVRLPQTWLPSLLFAGVLIGIAIMGTPQDGPTTPAMIGTARGTFLFGQAAAILLTVQFYRPNASDPSRPGLFVLFGGVLTLIAACNSFDQHYLQELLPLAAVLAALALRSVRGHITPSKLTVALLIPALGVALVIGWASLRVVRENSERLTEWGNRFMNERPQPELMGISQQPSLGPTFGARGTNARVLRLIGTPRIPHLRGVAYETYSEGRWWPTVTSRSMIPIDPEQLSLSIPRNSTPNRVSVTRLQNSDSLIFFPLETFTLELGEAEQMEWSQESSGPVRVRAPQPYTYLYQEVREGFQGLMALPGLRTPADRSAHLQLSENLTEALLPLATQITKNARTPQAKVDAITTYLLENYPYSLTFSPPSLPTDFGADPTDRIVAKQSGRREVDMLQRFLLANPKQGAHCEFFASSAAVLLRCVGVPTRYVTGYFAHEQESANSLIVRQRDAHAWCEAWIEGKGWVTVEATPPTGWPDADKSSIEMWRQAWEGFEDAWQRLLVFLAYRDPTQLALLAIIPFVGIGLGALWQRRRHTRLAPALNTFLPPPNLAELAHRFEALLPSLPPSEPWSERLDALPEDARPVAKRFVALYQQARFGGMSADSLGMEAVLMELEVALLQPRSGTR